MGLVGESGSGKSVTGFALLGLIDPPGSGRGRGPLQGPGPAQVQRRTDAPAARRPHRDDLPGSADDAEPGAAHRRADDGSHPDARGRAARASARAAAKRWKWWASLARKAPEELSARVLRRHAPARGHRHRHAEQARPDHLRRAHHRAGRHHPGPDPLPHAGDLPSAQHRADLDHSRPGRGRRAGRPRGRHVCRPHRRERPGRAGAGSAAPSIHARPAGLDAGRHAARRAPAPDQRHGAQPVRPSLGLCVPAALPQRGHALHRASPTVTTEGPRSFRCYVPIARETEQA